MQKINSPEIVAQVAQRHDAYERALVANDNATVRSFFWDSPDVIRFGIREEIYGTEALTDYLRTSTQVFLGRRMVRRSLLALGQDIASVMSENDQEVAGQVIFLISRCTRLRFTRQPSRLSR